MKIDEIIEKVNWDKEGGVVPVVVQDEDGVVLTLGYMNRESLKKTLETGYMHYYSRSKGRVRMKGEVSGNVQEVKNVKIDCDNDALLITVKQRGVACHTGNYSCFYRELGKPERYIDMSIYSLEILKILEDVVKDRKINPKDNSYTSYLFEKGEEEIKKKIGEEAVEVILAEGKERIVYEVSDLIYHIIVYLVFKGIELKDVMKELSRRRKGEDK